jgi:DedD protein
VAAKATEADKVQALLDGKVAQEPVAAGRFVVQVGAFADPVRAREVRLKLERAGLKTYTHVAETKDGPRTRVRVGPFSSKAEAEKTAEKIKKLNLPAGLLTL